VEKFNSIWEGGDIPESWETSVLRLILARKRYNTTKKLEADNARKL